MQSLEMNGLPKAMILVKGADNDGNPEIIVRCFNGVTGSTTNGCGFSVDWIYQGDEGDNSISVIDFGFPVETYRFVIADLHHDGGIVYDRAFWIRHATGQQVVLQNWEIVIVRMMLSVANKGWITPSLSTDIAQVTREQNHESHIFAGRWFDMNRWYQYRFVAPVLAIVAVLGLAGVILAGNQNDDTVFPTVVEDVSSTVVALGPGFAFQGQLADDDVTGEPLAGPCDLRFGLYDAATGGSKLGEVQRDNVKVVNGIFAVNLDFDPKLFSGEGRWLHLETRCPAGVGDFLPAPSRHERAAVPYALGLRPGARVIGSVPSGPSVDAGIKVFNSSTSFHRPLRHRQRADRPGHRRGGQQQFAGRPCRLWLLQPGRNGRCGARRSPEPGCGAAASTGWAPTATAPESIGVMGESPNGGGVFGKSTNWRGVTG